MILAIDPGPVQSAVLLYDVFMGKPAWGYIVPNEQVAGMMFEQQHVAPRAVVIEWIHSMGMAVGAEVFDTCRWVGRFEQSWLHTPACYSHGKGKPVTLIPRRDVKLAICGSARAKDANIRQAIIDRFGGKAKAIGSKRAPGPLYGIKSHLWSALAVALAWEQIERERQAR